MDETTWVGCKDPEPMMGVLDSSGKLSKRKIRLLGVAMCRRIWLLLSDERSRRAVEFAERLADEVVANSERAEVARSAKQAAAQLDGKAYWAALGAKVTAAGNPPLMQMHLFTSHSIASPGELPGRLSEHADLLRDLFGPLLFREVQIDPAWLTWNNGVVVTLARSAYDDRILPEGTLDRTRLAVLADALEEASADASLVSHLHELGRVHVRGCWVLDLLLKKE